MKIRQKQIWIFLAVWLLINLLQALFTEITADEAYYWMYSQYLDWGYFDHPPMIALLIKIGYTIFPNELGVRLFPVFFGTGTVYLIWLLLGRPRDWQLFILMIGSIVLMHLHLAGFLAIPDTPMLFFAALFFLIYRKYLDEDKIKWALLLSLAIAGMFYSKYHGSLVVFFTLIGNLKILLRKSFWLIVFCTIIIFLPHIIWQYQHDFISLEYHLIGRNDPNYFKQFYDYLINQVLVTGPLVGVILLYLSFGRHTVNTFERVMKFNLVGFFAFFLLSSLKDHVEPHWTAAAFIPMIILAFPELMDKSGWRKWFRTLAFISIPLILIGRFWLINPFIPVSDHVYRMFHGKKQWAADVARLADGRPVVFANQYQGPSVYRFYTGNFAHTRTNVDYRMNQYDLWNFEEQLFGQEVLFFINRFHPGQDTLISTYGKQTYIIPEKFQSFNRVRTRILDEDLTFGPGEDVMIRIELANPTGHDISFDSCEYPPQLFYINYWGKADYEYKAYLVDFDFTDISAGSSQLAGVWIHTPDKEGISDIAFWIGDEYLLPGINGKYRKMTISAD